MASFGESCRVLFATFGYPLTEGDSLPPRVLAEAEERLGVRVPAALREYYLIAGRERRFNTCHNRLLPPSDWRIDKKRPIFMEENQSVAWWGVSVRSPGSADPPVSQGINDRPITWRPEHRQCSVFLAVMLHYQAVNGGFRFCGTAAATDQAIDRLQEQGWNDCGEVNTLLACHRPNQVVCLTPPGDLPFMRHWTVFAGGKTRRDLQSIADDLGVSIK